MLVCTSEYTIALQKAESELPVLSKMARCAKYRYMP